VKTNVLYYGDKLDILEGCIPDETVEEPTRQEAATAGLYHSELWNRDLPRAQIITVRELLGAGRRPSLPPFVLPSYHRAQKIKGTLADLQEGLSDKPAAEVMA
jgi:hypothetical protein